MFKWILVLSVLIVAACSHKTIRSGGSAIPFVKSEYRAGDVRALCEAALRDVNMNIEAVIEALVQKKAPQDFTHTYKTLDLILYNFRDTVEPLNFMAYVSQNKSVRDEGIECEEKMNQFFVQLYTRKDIYDLFRNVAADPKEPFSKRLISEYKMEFEQSGMKLSAAKLEEFKKLKTELSSLEAQFSKNLNEDTSFLAFTEDQLSGAPESFLARLKKDAQGRRIVTTKKTDFDQVQNYVQVAETRKAVLQKYNQRGGPQNIELLQKAIVIRQKLAHLMGFKTWADYQTQDRMAKNSSAVWSFYAKLKSKLIAKNRSDLARLLKAKQKTEDPKAKRLEPWDIGFFTTQVKKTDYNLDDEMIREYFPKDYVMSGMFDIYGTLFGITFEEIKNAPVWSNDVKMYAVRDQDSRQILSYFYTDFVPRDGKYGHAAAFTLRNGRQLPNAGYNQPMAAIVANFTPPTHGKPALLSHEEVETLFHEFGHIMHQILTSSPYGLLSGANVAQDFVEAPSQMLEGWVWNKTMLLKISGHYAENFRSLPEPLAQKIIDAKNFNQGYFYARQFYLGNLDFTLHTQKRAVDAVSIHKNMYRNVLGLQTVEGDLFPSSFGHLMGGYDAGYYGYLWSEVYAADMLSVFENTDMLSKELGRKYRQTILESGDNEDAKVLVEKFLGRKSNTQAFSKQLGL